MGIVKVVWTIVTSTIPVVKMKEPENVMSSGSSYGHLGFDSRIT
jgi:hypothetical protein